jgi:hypothetical protein
MPVRTAIFAWSYRQPIVEVRCLGDPCAFHLDRHGVAVGKAQMLGQRVVAGLEHNFARGDRTEMDLRHVPRRTGSQQRDPRARAVHAPGDLIELMRDLPAARPGPEAIWPRLAAVIGVHLGGNDHITERDVVAQCPGYADEYQRARTEHRDCPFGQDGRGCVSFSGHSERDLTATARWTADLEDSACRMVEPAERRQEPPDGQVLHIERGQYDDHGVTVIVPPTRSGCTVGTASMAATKSA